MKPRLSIQWIGFIGSLAIAAACHRVQEDGPALDADAGFTSDTPGELVIDVPYFDAPKETKAETEVVDAPPPAKEACGNKIDDDLDGSIDEEGCYPAPNLRTDQQWTDLGIVELQALLGPAPTRTFHAPSKNAAMAILMTDLPDPGQLAAYVWAESLASPSGVECISPGAWATSYNRAFVGIGYATVQLGMAPQISLLPGPWKIGATRATELPLNYSGKPLAGWLHLGALARPELPPNGKGLLDLDVFCVGGAPMPCAQLATSPQWQQMAAKINATWKSGNIELGQVEFFDLGGDEGSKFKVLDNVGSNGDDNELTQVYKAASKLRPKSTRPALVLVSALNHKGVPVATGLSQLAGIAGMAGARVNGMAVAFNEADFAKALTLPADSPYPGDVWGLVIAHEIGHFLGLWHTDEADGVLHDLIDDTPTCTKKVDVLTADECPVQAKYLMFWQPKGATLTAGQIKVARNNPALRP